MIPQEPLERLRKLADEIGLTRIDLDPLVDDLRVAVAFYTRLPVAQPTPVDGAALARAAWAAPLVGALIGALGALAYWIAIRLNLAACMRTGSPTRRTVSAAAPPANRSSTSCATAASAPTGPWRSESRCCCASVRSPTFPTRAWSPAR
jgi:hypothetical protein